MFEMKNYDDMKIEIDEFKKKYPKAFANINDKNELTVIIEKSKVKKEDVINIENDWKLITFDTVLDFSLLNSKWYQSYSAYDLFADGIINSLDYVIMSINWLKTW